MAAPEDSLARALAFSSGPYQFTFLQKRAFRWGASWGWRAVLYDQKTLNIDHRPDSASICEKCSITDNAKIRNHTQTYGLYRSAGEF